ncbi:MAG: hypothetical protein ACOC3B_01075 [Bacillota bacterium]
MKKTKNAFFVFTRTDLIFLLIIFILGIISGSTFITIYSGKNIDKLILENKKLSSTIEEQEKKIEQLDKQFQNQLIVHSITPELDSDLNKHTQQEIIKKTRNLLDGLLGKDISEIDPLLLRDIINEAYIMVEGHSYQLKLLYIVISDELKLYLKVNSVTNNNDNKE